MSWVVYGMSENSKNAYHNVPEPKEDGQNSSFQHFIHTVYTWDIERGTFGTVTPLSICLHLFTFSTETLGSVQA